MGGVWPWVLGLLSLPGCILGAPAASSCPGACDTSSPGDLTAEGTQETWGPDIPAINQGLTPEETPESSFLLEGDIIRPSPFQLLSADSSRWPKTGDVVEVPFLLSSKYDEHSRGVILAAFAEFEHFTCIRFVPYEGQRDFISIVPMSGCFSGVGRGGGMQLVSLAPACLQRGPGIALHELMHVLGFWHEHARADRDRYIRIDWREIRPGFEINFIKSQSSNMLVPYDYSSVMHYGRLAFSRRGAPTIVPLWAPHVHLGQRRNLSASDVTRVLRLYACGPRRAGSQNPTQASRPYLQRLLSAMMAESRTPHPGGPRAGGQRVAAGPGESPAGWEPPASRKFRGDASARPPQAPRSRPPQAPRSRPPQALRSSPGARAPGTALARAPTVPPAPAPAPAAGSQPAPI